MIEKIKSSLHDTEISQQFADEVKALKKTFGNIGLSEQDRDQLADNNEDLLNNVNDVDDSNREVGEILENAWVGLQENDDESILNLLTAEDDESLLEKHSKEEYLKPITVQTYASSKEAIKAKAKLKADDAIQAAEAALEAARIAKREAAAFESDEESVEESVERVAEPLMS